MRNYTCRNFCHVSTHTHTRSRGLPCNDGEQLLSDDGCACKRRRRRVEGENVGQLFCSTDFLLKRPKQSRVQQNTVVTQPLLHLTAHPLPLFSTCLHSNIILSPFTVTAFSLAPARSFSRKRQWLSVVCTQSCPGKCCLDTAC